MFGGVNNALAAHYAHIADMAADKAKQDFELKRLRSHIYHDPLTASSMLMSEYDGHVIKSGIDDLHFRDLRESTHEENSKTIKKKAKKNKSVIFVDPSEIGRLKRQTYIVTKGPRWRTYINR